jgi:pseudouridine-5'-phosphate glycosidase
VGIELRIFKMAQFIGLESIVSHGMSIPQDIRMVIPVQGVRIRM